MHRSKVNFYKKKILLFLINLIYLISDLLIRQMLSGCEHLFNNYSISSDIADKNSTVS